MNMPMPFSAMDAVVFAAFAFALALTIAWLASPRLRNWIERPKYRFQDSVESYDRSRGMVASKDRDS